VLFTGSLATLTRSEAERRAVAAGAHILGGVSKKLDLLVVGDKPGGKLDKATKLGIRVLREQEFLDLLEGRGGDAPATTPADASSGASSDVPGGAGAAASSSVSRNKDQHSLI
jgi:DNA ligase (NAD+)